MGVKEQQWGQKAECFYVFPFDMVEENLEVGQNENVIVMVKSNHGITTEVIPLMVKEWDGEDIHSDSGRHLN